MTVSIVDGFGALGDLSSDNVWSSRLRQKAAEILAASGAEAEPELAKAYLAAEQEIIHKSGGKLYEDDVRRKLKPVFAQYAKEYPNLNLLFYPNEAQLIRLGGLLIGAFAEECRTFIGIKNAEAMLQGILENAGWAGVKVGVAEGIEYDPVRFRTVQECIEALSLLYSAWYKKNAAMLGVWPSRRAFERAFQSVVSRYGFLPASRNLLGATPLEVLGIEKAKRLHELETETTTQARSIRAADEGLHRQAERLQRTVEELEETKRKLEITSQARSTFIDVVSHQFRTPLSSMRWNAEMLYDDLGSKSGTDPAHKEAIDNIRTKSVYLIETLDRVFTALDIDTGSLSLDRKPAFLWEVVQDVYGNFERDIKAKGLKWKFNRTKEQVKEVPFDKAKIAGVLKIVIGNAVVYNKDGGKITVDIAPETADGVEYLVCSVSDEGIGITSAEAEKLFDKFYRSKQAVLKVADGTGLGNYIVKHVVEAHKGFVRAESAGDGKGMKIVFGLPMA